MILREPRKRPGAWSELRRGARYGWMVPFLGFEWCWEWVAYFLSNWRFLEVLEYLGSFSVLVGVIFYFSESGNRTRQRHYQAWQVINTAQGKGGSGGRIDALQELNKDGVPLVGVDVSSAFLEGLRMERAELLRANFSGADMRFCDLRGADFTDANLRAANMRQGSLQGVQFGQADMADADLWGADLSDANLDGATLDGADLSYSNFQGVDWRGLKSVKMANLEGVKNAPAGFVEWALSKGAVESTSTDN